MSRSRPRPRGAPYAPTRAGGKAHDGSTGQGRASDRVRIRDGHCRRSAIPPPIPPSSELETRSPVTADARPAARLARHAFLDSLHQFVAHYGYFAVFVLVALESAGVPLPGETALVYGRGFRRPGDTQHRGGHRLRRRGGDSRRQSRLLGRPRVRLSAASIATATSLRIDEGRLKVAQYLFLRHGGKIVFFGRFVAILRAFAAFLAGVNNCLGRAFSCSMRSAAWSGRRLFGLGGYFLGLAFETYARPSGSRALDLRCRRRRSSASRFVAHHAEDSLRAEAEAALPGPLLARRRA